MDIKIGIEMLMNRLLKKKKPSLTERLERQVTSTTKIDEKTKNAPIDHSYFNINIHCLHRIIVVYPIELRYNSCFL